MSRKNRIARFTFQDARFLAGKAAIASGLAYGGAHWLNNPDVITATFVAVLCCSPAVSIGAWQGLSQLVGSALGGGLGVLAIELGMPLWAGIPVAVGLSILVTYKIGFKQGSSVAAFTALFVQVVPFGSVEMNWLLRQEAVIIAGVSAAIVNVIVSALFYPRVFRKRLRKVDDLVDGLLEEAETNPLAVNPGFRVLGELDRELLFAARELKFRRADDQLEQIKAMHRWVEHQVRMLHYVFSLGLLVEEQELSPEETAPIIRWARNPTGDPPDLPENMRVLASRLVHEVERAGVRPV